MIAPPPPAHLAHLATPRTAPPPPPHLAHLTTPQAIANVKAIVAAVRASQPERPGAVLDVECYPNYFLIRCRRIADRVDVGLFELYDGQVLDVAGLLAFLQTYTVYTFNGNGYDVPMVTAALAGYDNRNLKWLSDKIIVGGLRPWEVEREFNLRAPACLDHVDIIEILPGMHGLKMYMAKMHSPRLQELPIDPGTILTRAQMVDICTYCGNDLDGTIDAVLKFKKELALRVAMSAEYGVDLRSKSDAQIAEVVIVHELGGPNAVPRPEWATGTWFHYEPPAFLAYQTPMLRELLRVVATARFVLGPNGIEMPPELDAAKIIIGSSTYRLGIGGLHSSESSVYHVSDDDVVLQDVDVRSYYPTLMLNSGAFPPQMGPAFLRVFKRIVDTRLARKDVAEAIEKQWGSKKNIPSHDLVTYNDAKGAADSLKIVINGTFGKTLSKYGKLVAPKMGIQTTVTGQLSLLMLIEALEVVGIPVVSANTDGIVIKCRRSMTWLRDDVVKWWELTTGLETEAVVYSAIYSRDVNNYVAIKAKDGEVKRKGAYAESIPVGGSWPNYTGEVCVDAVIAYLTARTPIEQTVYACTDIRKFVHIRNVKGGGVKFWGEQIEAATRQDAVRAQLAAAGWHETAPKSKVFVDAVRGSDMLPMKEAHKLAVQQLRADNPVRQEYLGKVVRWYYGKGATGAIRYKTNGNLVAKTEGAVPCMDLPTTLPGDVDYDWYVREAKSMLTDLGVPII
jgi:hypothetical protein